MRNRRIELLIFVSFAFIGFLLLNFYSPRTMDDFHYAFMFTEFGRSTIKISSIFEIPASQFHHYFSHNGRSLVHSLAQFFSFQKSDVLFNILNSMAVVALITLMTLYAKMKTAYNNLNKLWVASFLLFWFLVPSPSMTLMWKTGSLNYLWTATLITAFLCIHHKLSAGHFSKTYLLPILFFIGVVCGWGHEGLSIGISLGLLLHHISHRKSISPSIVFLVIGFWIGTSMVVFSPGILSRADGSLLSPSLFTVVSKRAMALYRMFFEAQTKASLILVLGMLALFLKNRKSLKEFRSKNSLLFMSFVSFFVFQVLTAFPGQGRGAMGMELVAMLLILIYLINIRGTMSLRVKKIAIPVLFLLFGIDYASALSSCAKNSNSAKTLLSDYLKAENGVVRSSFSQTVLNDRFIFYLYSFDPNYPQNVAFARFYDTKKPLVVLDKTLYDQIHFGGDLFTNENLVHQESDFYTTPELDCYVARQDFDADYHKKRSAFVKYDVEPFSSDFLNQYTASLKAGVRNHYSGLEKVTILNINKGRYLLVPKKELPSAVTIAEIKLIE
jgi:hypothetical protein